MIHTVKRFNTVSETEVDVFMELPYFLHDSVNASNLISCSSAFSKPSLYMWKFLAQVLMKPSLKDFEHNFDNLWNDHKCMVVGTFFGIVLLWDWNENSPFPVVWPLLSFPNFLTFTTANESPVQVRCMILDAWGWCTGTTQRDGMGREVGGGFTMGNTFIPVVDSVWYMARPIQYCKVKK